jgi:hypothetical protein
MGGLNWQLKLSAGSEKFLGIVGNGKIKYWETISEQGLPLYYPYPGAGFQAQFRKKMRNLPSFYIIRIAQKLSASNK